MLASEASGAAVVVGFVMLVAAAEGEAGRQLRPEALAKVLRHEPVNDRVQTARETKRHGVVHNETLGKF